ncbi:MAG: hypothetical protein AAF438_18710 [Pseudomonadota bacterium]
MSRSLDMPAPRAFGWDLKALESSAFEIHQRDNGQFCVVLAHSLLRGVRAEMIHWWFMNFTNMKVRLRDVPGYEEQVVPAYLLWHPVDHLSAELTGKLGPGNTPKPGCAIRIREAMQYDTYGWKYPVDSALKVFYVGDDGWAMGKTIPMVGAVMMLRIHYKDIFDGHTHLGVQYHYEVVIGASGASAVARLINKNLTSKFGPEFFTAWQRHNVIEVGTFENFLPALFAQKHSLEALEYAREMNPTFKDAAPQRPLDQTLFEQRIHGYRNTDRPHGFQNYEAPSFL